jgi:hypothetical protein
MINPEHIALFPKDLRNNFENKNKGIFQKK